jgi:hypothetical protein
MYRLGFHSHTASGMAINATANASGLAQGFLGPVPPGYCWYVERMTTWSNSTATNCELEIFAQADSQAPAGFSATVGDRTNRQDLSVVAGDDVSDNIAPIYIGEGYYLVAIWTGLNSGDLATLSTQIAVHQITLPEYANTKLDIAEMHIEYHESDREQAAAPPPHN